VLAAAALLVGVLPPRALCKTAAGPTLDEILTAWRTSNGRITRSEGTFTVLLHENRDSDAATSAMMHPTRLAGSWAMSGNRLREETIRTYPELAADDSSAQDRRQARDRVSRTTPASPMQGTTKQVVVFDGSECRIVQYRDGRRDADDRITGDDAGRQAWGVTEFWKWLGMTLPGASGPSRGTYPTASPGTAVVGTERIDGVDCVKVQWRQESPGCETTWWIAPGRGYLALRRDEVRYYPPGTGLAPGQYTLTRRRVTEVEDFGSGIWLPMKVERTVAWVNADGSVARVLRRFEFTASDVKVNERVDPGNFDIARLPPGYEGESRPAISPPGAAS
jgi:hypothetical protein